MARLLVTAHPRRLSSYQYNTSHLVPIPGYTSPFRHLALCPSPAPLLTLDPVCAPLLAPHPVPSAYTASDRRLVRVQYTSPRLAPSHFEFASLWIQVGSWIVSSPYFSIPFPRPRRRTESCFSVCLVCNISSLETAPAITSAVFDPVYSIMPILLCVPGFARLHYKLLSP